jgi:hypothetical protein
LEKLPLRSGTTNRHASANAVPSSKAAGTVTTMASPQPRTKMLAQIATPNPSREGAELKGQSFTNRLAEIHRTSPLKLASLNLQPSTPNSITGFVMDYDLVQTCWFQTFQSEHTYLIDSDTVIDYATFESGSVTKFGGGSLTVTYYLDCPASDPKAVLTDVNDDSVGDMISGSAHHFTGYHYGTLDLSQADNGGSGYYVRNLDIRFVSCGIIAPTDYNWCYIYDCWFFKCNEGVDDSGGNSTVSSSDFCAVDYPYSGTGSTYYSYTWTTCAVDRNNNGLPDAWEYDNFASFQPANGDFDGDGITNLQEYQNGFNPAQSNNQTTSGYGIFVAEPRKNSIVP